LGGKKLSLISKEAGYICIDYRRYGEIMASKHGDVSIYNTVMNRTGKNFARNEV
jgi:hypothetical protein